MVCRCSLARSATPSRRSRACGCASCRSRLSACAALWGRRCAALRVGTTEPQTRPAPSPRWGEGVPPCLFGSRAIYEGTRDNSETMFLGRFSMLQTRRTALLLAATLILTAGPAAAQTPATVFEGARVITGDGNVIENGSIVVEGNRIVAVGRRADVFVPAGARRVDLAGKTVMPTMTDLHGHLGFQNVAAGTMSKETFTRENLIDHL